MSLGTAFGLQEVEWGEAERARALAGLQAATGAACKPDRQLLLMSLCAFKIIFLCLAFAMFNYDGVCPAKDSRDEA